MKQTIYTASPESQQIHVWQLNSPQETLDLLQVVEVDAQVQPLVISPDGRFLYAGVRPEFCVLAFHIAPEDGALTLAGSAPLPASPTHLSLDGKGDFLFCASYNAGCVSVSRLESGLPLAAQQVINGLEGCHSANLAADNCTLWVPALKQDRICLFNLDDNGNLRQHTPSQVTTLPGAGPRHMVFHPREPVAYCINELNACLDVWLIQGDDIRCVQRLDIMPEGFSATRWAADIHITPDGRFIYACERNASIITSFALSDSGLSLSLIAHQPTETQPRGFNIDHQGEFLIAAGQKSGHICLYKIDKMHGTLQEKARYATGQGTMWVAINNR